MQKIIIMEVPIKGEANNILADKSTISSDNVEYKVVMCKSKKLTEYGAYGTGKRKSAIARVWIKAGQGRIMINKKDINTYFANNYYVKSIYQPFLVTSTPKQYDMVCTVKGGGVTGQIDAITHGISRALDCLSKDFHKNLHEKGLLTRDSRVVERKKYGLRKARKSRQYSKR